MQQEDTKPTYAALAYELCTCDHNRMPEPSVWAWTVAQRINATMLLLADQCETEMRVWCEAWPKEFSLLLPILKSFGYEAERMDTEHGEHPHQLRVAYMQTEEEDAFVLPYLVLKDALQVWQVEIAQWASQVL